MRSKRVSTEGSGIRWVTVSMPCCPRIKPQVGRRVNTAGWMSFLSAKVSGNINRMCAVHKGEEDSCAVFLVEVHVLILGDVLHQRKELEYNNDLWLGRACATHVTHSTSMEGTHGFRRMEPRMVTWSGAPAPVPGMYF